MAADHRSVMLLAASAIFIIVALMPVTFLLLDSFTSDQGLNLATYHSILSNKRQTQLLKNTIKLSVAVTILSTLMGVPLSILLYKTDLPLQKIYRIAFISILIVPPYIGAIAWINLMGSAGYLNQAISGITGLKSPLFDIYGFWGSVLVLTLSTFPLVVLLSGGALNSIDKNLEEAAIISRGYLKSITAVTLRLASPGITLGALLVFITVVSDFGVVSFLTYDTFTIEIYSQLAAFYDTKTATAYSLVLIALALPPILLHTRIYGTKTYTSIFSATTSKTLKLGKWRKPALVATTLLLTISLILPLSTLAYTSLFFYGKFSHIQNYLTSLNQGMSNITNSLLYSLAGSTASMILGFTIAYGLRQKNNTNKKIFDMALTLPYILPGTIIGLGLIILWNNPTLLIYNTPIIIIIGYMAKYTFIASKTSEIALNKISRSLEEAAELTGSMWHKTLRKITLPLSSPTLSNGWILTYILCMTELNTTIMVYPPGQATLPISLYILQHDGPPGLVAALAVTLILITLAPIVSLTTIRWLKTRKSSS
ncbi:MAG: iron ABC transporter permease [Candidatus Altiarchaeota archaeon]